MSRQVIRIHPDAPLKPAETAPCNGCGVCCAAEPCPIGVLVSGRRTGACAALSWNADAGLYRCGLVAAPRTLLPWLPAAVAPLLSRLARRWISAASGCDSSLVVEASQPAAAANGHRAQAVSQVTGRRMTAAVSSASPSSTLPARAFPE